MIQITEMPAIGVGGFLMIFIQDDVTQGLGALHQGVRATGGRIKRARGKGAPASPIYGE